MAEEKKSDYKYKGIGLSENERRIAHKRFNEYCERYSITNISDYSLLEDLCYREYLMDELKASISEKKIKAATDNKEFIIPSYLIANMNNNLEQVLSLKEKLGMLNDRTNSDGFDYIQKLKEKFKKWEEENQGSRTFVCPHCSKMLMLHVKPNMWEVQEHKFFRDKIICNEHLIKLYKENKITKEDAALILGVSPQYILWLIEKWFRND